MDRLDAATGLNQAVRESLKGVREHLEAIDAEIERLEAELTALKGVRKVAVAVIRAADPTSPRPGRKPGRLAESQTVGREYVEAVKAYLSENYGPGDDLVAAAFYRDEAFQAGTGGAGRPQKISRAFWALRDEGVIRLDRQEGNAKVYRLIERGSDGKP